MCPLQVIGAGVALASSFAQMGADQEDYNNKVAQKNQNSINALAAGVEDQKKIALRMTQEQDAYYQKTHETRVQEAEATARAEVSAAEGGVGGLSLGNILLGIQRDANRNLSASRTNYENTVVQLQAENQATNSTIKNQINSVATPTKPNHLGTILGGIGGALGKFQ